MCVLTTSRARRGTEGTHEKHSKLAASRSRFSPSPSAFAASAETQEEQNACMNDAFNVCGHDIPDRERSAACLARNIKRISPACRTVMLRY